MYNKADPMLINLTRHVAYIIYNSRFDRQPTATIPDNLRTVYISISWVISGFSTDNQAGHTRDVA